MANALRRIWQERTAYGAWCTVAAPLVAELFAIDGFDWVCLDCQHGLIDYDSMVPMLQAMARTQATPVVRVPGNDPYAIGKALDAGAQTVIVPMVSTPAEAERASAACRYSPAGTRSIGAVRGALFLPGTTDEVNAEVGLLVMIETAEGVARAEEICRTPGVDGVYIGPRDLANGLRADISDEVSPDRLREAIGRVLAACQATGAVPGIHAATGTAAREYADMGFRVVNATSDTGLLRTGARRELAATRAGRAVASE
jgi:4-hydroxy-2-oxoheptanedioate aldolase